VIYLLSRPFVWLAKLIKTVLMAPARAIKMNRAHKLRKDVKELKKARAA
jgi:hypothetical protein